MNKQPRGRRMHRHRSIRHAVPLVIVGMALAVGLSGVVPAAAAGSPTHVLSAASMSARDGQPVLPAGWSWQPGSPATLGYLAGARASGDARWEFRLGAVVLGQPRTDDSGQRLILALAPEQLRAVGAAPGNLSAWASGRRMDASPPPDSADDRQAADQDLRDLTDQLPSNGAAPGSGRRPADSYDPGTPGPYGAVSATYKLAPIRLPGLRQPVEVEGVVVAPRNARGARPVVLILHGRHSTCYQPAAPANASAESSTPLNASAESSTRLNASAESSMDWPCRAGWLPIPSAAGYPAMQRLLASRGFLTVSIAANGINAQDADLPDSGASARSALVRYHLGLLAGWARGRPAPVLPGALLRADLRHVLLVGHSRGGEGVNRAVVDSAVTDPWRVRGLLLIAPTAFGRQTAPGVPVAVVLPYCDGDVADLQGQQYVDDSRAVADPALRSAVLVLGANHNYFNSQWTPGRAVAPAEDDWADPTDAACGTTRRLASHAQEDLGAVYASAAAAAFLREDARARPFLDGSAVRPASIGSGLALSAALAGETSVVSADFRPGTAVSGTSPVQTRVCPAWVSAADAWNPGSDASTPSCAGEVSGVTPHWLSVSYAGNAPPPGAWEVAWDRPAGSATLPVTGGAAVQPGDVLQLRVVLPGRVGRVRFAVDLTDRAGRPTATEPVTITALPGSADSAKAWARSVRIRVPAGLQPGPLRALTVRPLPGPGVRAGAGRLWVLDVARIAPVPAALTPRVPRVDVGSRTVVEGHVGRPHVDIPITVEAGPTPVRLWVDISDPRTGGYPTGRAITVPASAGPGPTRLAIPIYWDANRRDDEDVMVHTVTVRALRGGVARQYVGGLTVLDDDPTPTLSVEQAAVRVTAGQPLRWVLRLSAPSNRYVARTLEFRAPPSGPPELTSDGVTARYLADLGVDPPPVPALAMSRLGLSTWVSFELGSTRTVVEIPTTALPPGAAPSQVRLLDVTQDVPPAARLRLSGAVDGPATDASLG